MSKALAIIGRLCPCNPLINDRIEYSPEALSVDPHTFLTKPHLSEHLLFLVSHADQLLDEAIRKVPAQHVRDQQGVLQQRSGPAEMVDQNQEQLQLTTR